MKVLLLSRYGPLGSSSRLRFYQYLPFLRQQGAEVTVSSFFEDGYVSRLYGGRPVSIPMVFRAYRRRARVLRRAGEFDLVWLEKEFFPWLPAFRLQDVPYVVDYDDATFHRYDRHRNPLVRGLLGRKIDAVMERAALVVAGNEYLAERARHAGAQRVEILPTVVDTSRYAARQSHQPGPPVVVWIGAPVTVDYLKAIRPVLGRFMDSNPQTRLHLVGAEDPLGMPGRVISFPWEEGTEAGELARADIGIMPLPDEPFERGKCGYKLIQYMAAGLPVIASPVGANNQIVEDGVNGYLAETDADWNRALEILAGDPDLRRRMGAAGRRKVEAQYSLRKAAPALWGYFRSLIADR